MEEGSMNAEVPRPVEAIMVPWELWVLWVSSAGT